MRAIARAAALVAGRCAGQDERIKNMGNPVVHFEFAGRDGGALEEFYSKLFDWTIERLDAGGYTYGFISTGGEGDIEGGIRHEPQGHAEVVVYVEVPDLDASVAAAQELGGKVRISPMDAANMRFAMISDPEGNPVGMIEKK